MSLKSKTITDSIYEIIESDIIAGVYKPGQRLMEAEIAQKLQVSRMPVRDVMIRLEQKGLVTIKAHCGVYVRKMTREDIRDAWYSQGLDSQYLLVKQLPLRESLVGT